jgi:hypothetical protein
MPGLESAWPLRSKSIDLKGYTNEQVFAAINDFKCLRLTGGIKTKTSNY